jgi:hypothetical protein
MEAADTYRELIAMMDNSIKATDSTTSGQKQHCLDVLALLDEQFDTLFEICRASSIQISTDFTNYREILQHQLADLIKLECAKLHMGLDTWRTNWTQHQINRTSQQLAVAAHSESAKIAQLEQSLSALTLRSGLIKEEKKAMMLEVSQGQQKLAFLENTISQMEISHKTTCDEYERRITSSNSKRHEAEVKQQEVDVKLEQEVERAATVVHQLDRAEKLLTSEVEKARASPVVSAHLQESNNASTPRQATLQEKITKLVTNYNLTLEISKIKRSSSSRRRLRLPSFNAEVGKTWLLNSESALSLLTG